MIINTHEDKLSAESKQALRLLQSFSQPCMKKRSMDFRHSYKTVYSLNTHQLFVYNHKQAVIQGLFHQSDYSDVRVPQRIRKLIGHKPAVERMTIAQHKLSITCHNSCSADSFFFVELQYPGTHSKNKLMNNKLLE